MDILLLTPVRLLADGLSACFEKHTSIRLRGVASGFGQLRGLIAQVSPQLLLIDVTHGIELAEVRAIAQENEQLALVALGLLEQRQPVIRCGRAGFSGYVSREATAEQLCEALSNVVAGRLSCPAEISGGLLRALFRADRPEEAAGSRESLTRREDEVLALIGRGYSNKEIARDLHLSVATVKHHVHNVLEKLQIKRRSEAMRQVREDPWARSPYGTDSTRARTDAR